MSILFLNGDYPFCYYYRGLLPGVYGNQMVIKDYLNGKIDSTVVLEQAKRASTVVFQRPSNKKTIELIKVLKSMGKKVIFENDDTYTALPLERLGNDKQREIAKELSANLNEALSLCHGAIASTEILGEEYRKINTNTIVLKNCIDPLDEFPCKENITGKFRIGFIGSVTTNDDYLHIKDQIKQLDDRGDITIVVMGVKYKDGTHIPIMKEDHDFWDGLKNIEWHPYVAVNQYMSTVASLALDLAIIPRKEHYFNQCKSNLKFLEMSLLKIPVLAQGFSDGTSPYQGVDESHMTVVTDNTQWYNSVINIKDNYPKYKSIAYTSHSYVLENYNIKNYAQTWVNSIENL